MKKPARRAADRRGMTLLEVMFAVAMLTVVMGTLFGLSFGFANAVQVQDIRITASDEARRAMQWIVPDVRQAQRGSINWGELPGDTLSYRVAADVSGNGTAVDEDGRLELSDVRVIARDLDDVNGDGLTESQVIVTSGGSLRVLANQVSPDDPGADDGPAGRGLWFEPWGNGLRITVQTEGVDRQGHTLRYTLQEVVYPRN